MPSAGNIGRFAYTGQTRIDELGLYYYKARIYNPWLGRFMQTDPIGYDDDLNLYAYVKNDPINATDPTGTEILLKTHATYGHNHAKVVIIPKNQAKYANDKRFSQKLPDGRRFATLGAGPGGVRNGTLISDPNRPNDVSRTKDGLDTSMQVLTPPGGDEDRAIELLFATDDNYLDNERYDATQFIWANGYNSNGYANGLLGAAGFRGYSAPPSARGWDNPVPIKKGEVTVECTSGYPDCKK